MSQGSKWRELTAKEAACLRRLVAMSVPGVEALREQARSGVEGRTVDEDGSLELRGPDGPRFERVVHQNPSRDITLEVRGADVDGADIVALLHVRDGLLRELEFFRPGGGAVIDLPSPHAWREW